MIPKIIHQIWLNHPTRTDPKLISDTQSPPKYNTSYYCQSFQSHHPDFEYRFWTWKNLRPWLEENRLSLQPHWLSFLENPSLRHIERCDFARILVVYVLGGVYADCDFHCVQSLNPLLEQARGNTGAGTLLVTLDIFDHLSFFVSVLNFFHIAENQRTVFNGFFAASPHHPHLAYMMDYIIDHYKPGGYVLENTGPVAWSRAHIERSIPQKCFLPSQLLMMSQPKKNEVHYLENKWCDGSNWAFESMDGLRFVPKIIGIFVALGLFILLLSWLMGFGDVFMSSWNRFGYYISVFTMASLVSCHYLGIFLFLPH